MAARQPDGDGGVRGAVSVEHSPGVGHEGLGVVASQGLALGEDEHQPAQAIIGGYRAVGLGAEPRPHLARFEQDLAQSQWVGGDLFARGARTGRQQHVATGPKAGPHALSRQRLLQTGSGRTVSMTPHQQRVELLRGLNRGGGHPHRVEGTQIGCQPAGHGLDLVDQLIAPFGRSTLG